MLKNFSVFSLPHIMSLEMTFFYLALVVLPILLILLLILCTRPRRAEDQKTKLPPLPSPPALPIIGHLHLYKDREHRSLQSLADRYGPVFHLRLGQCRVLVVSSPQAAEECFTKNDVIFAGKPKFLRGEILGNNYSTAAWAPYGEYWRNLRRISTIETLSTVRVNQFASIREQEVRFVAQESLLGGGEVDLSCVFFKMVKNVMMRIACGKRWPEVEESKSNAICNSVDEIINAYDFFPMLRWVGGLEKKMKSAARNWDAMWSGLVKDARNQEVEGERKNRAFIHRLLELQMAEPLLYTDDVIKALIVVVLFGGTDNVVRTMEWAMSLLLNDPAILHKARVEIDAHVSTSRLVNDSDLPNLPYLRCIINESFRLYPVSPLLSPHCATADTTVAGYHVPKGTTLLINLWALHRDPKVWEDPTAFKPERFERVDNTTSFKLMPFGVGRRACPGGNLTMRLVLLAMATCIQCFEWETVDGAAVDMEELGGGMSLRKKVTLHAVCRPRPCMADVISELSATSFDFN